MLLFAKVRELAETLALPVSMLLSPPVFWLEVLLPESAARVILLPTVASLLWKELSLEESVMLALFREPAPLFEFLAEESEPLQLETQLWLKSKIISPLWSSVILNSETATPSTLVFTAVIAVPETLASPV